MRRRLIWLLFCGLVLAGCGREPLYHRQSYVFGTLVDISIYGESEQRARALADHVLQDFQGLHNRLHAWQPASQLSKLNQAFAAGSKPVPVDAELARIINAATALSVQSGELFNPAIGRLIKEWGFHREEFTPPVVDTVAVKQLVAVQPQMTDIVIENGMAYSKNPAVQLDLGGYAKGYALDRAAAYLRARGTENALINIGGNIIALGRHGSRPWRVGIQHPRQPGPIATLELANGWAIGTSGDYQRFFMLNGKRYCHILDPRTGYPGQGTRSVTVLVPPGPQAGALSDAASKPIFLASSGMRARAAAAMGIAHTMLIDSQGEIFLSDAMARRLQWMQEDVAAKELH